MLSEQHGLSSLSPLLSLRKYLCGKINEKARAHRPQSVVGSRTGQHATDLELSSLGGSDQPFASQSPACRWPAAALGAAFLPTRPCARTDAPPKPMMPGALSRSCTLPQLLWGLTVVCYENRSGLLGTGFFPCVRPYLWFSFSHCLYAKP